MWTQSKKNTFRNVASAATLGLLLSTNSVYPSDIAAAKELRANNVSLDPNELLQYKLGVFLGAVALDGTTSKDPTIIRQSISNVQSAIGRGSSDNTLNNIKALTKLLNSSSNPPTDTLQSQVANAIQSLQYARNIGSDIQQSIGLINGLLGTGLAPSSGPTAVIDTYSMLAAALEAIDGEDGITGTIGTTLQARMIALATSLDGTTSVPGTCVGNNSNFLVTRYTGTTNQIFGSVSV